MGSTNYSHGKPNHRQKVSEQQETRLVAVLIVMPNLKSKKIKQIIKCLEVGRHTIEVNTERWGSLLKDAGISHKIIGMTGTYAISRSSLLRMPNSQAKDKCLEILMWGFPTGGLYGRVADALPYLSKIAKAASKAQPSWQAYYNSFARGWGVNASSITKFAYFFGHKFADEKAVILDRQIALTLNSARWRSAPQPVGNYPWKSTYVSYLTQIKTLAKSLGVKPDQIELFLYLLGPRFR